MTATAQTVPDAEESENAPSDRKTLEVRSSRTSNEDRTYRHSNWFAPLFAARRRKHRDIILASGLFDPVFYARQLNQLLAPSRGETTFSVAIARNDVSALVDHYIVTAHRQKLDPHPLFSSNFYLESYPDVERRALNPLLHYLRDGANEGRAPHALFDPQFYQEECTRAGLSGERRDLRHYLAVGRHTSIRCHPLFDAGYYVSQKPEISSADALSDFIDVGWRQGFNPNPFFDTVFYLLHSPDVRDAGLNPIEHYIRYGWHEWRPAGPLFDTQHYITSYKDVRASKINPLVHYLTFGHREGRSTSPWYAPSVSISSLFAPPARTRACEPARKAPSREVRRQIDIFCVYGASNVPFIRDVALPRYATQKSALDVNFHLLNYRSNEALFPARQELAPGLRIIDWSSQRSSEHIGFGPAHNFLFERVQPTDRFIIANPDSHPYSGCIEKLIATWSGTDAGIVEARQWPSEHPKEYSQQTMETPWASGAFSLIDSNAFRAVKGFDPVFFLYTEDVDLSWRIWLQGFRVLYQREALCCHLTGHLSYRNDRYYYENYYSFRNFLVMARKFFGAAGEESAVRVFLASAVPEPLKGTILRDFEGMRSQVTILGAVNHWAVCMYGLNLYHRLMPHIAYQSILAP